MFGNRFFPNRYFADRYFPPGGDVAADTGPELLGGKAYSFKLPWERYKEEKRKQEELDREIAAKERELEIERALAKRDAELRNSEILARQLEAREAFIREEINRLLMEKAALIRRMDEEEAILVLLLSMPFST